ncbi:hypothetical protein ACFW7K_01555 [Streptomyces sp. NPDC058735]|uniref:hypothetical protein n=1 Tax=Streptomyces sp. NPDC058735 TaxID=3346616 RepID=UPI00369BA4A8
MSFGPVHDQPGRRSALRHSGAHRLPDRGMPVPTTHGPADSPPSPGPYVWLDVPLDAGRAALERLPAEGVGAGRPSGACLSGAHPVRAAGA